MIGRIGIATFLGLFLCLQVAAAEQTDGLVLSFDYKDGAIKPEFLSWVAKFGARAPAAFEEGKTLPEYVHKACKTESASNVELFRQALAEQGVKLSGDKITDGPANGVLMLPPCLPDPTTTNVARLVLPGESLWNYVPSGNLQSSINVDGIKTFSPKQIGVTWPSDCCGDEGVDAVKDQYLNHDAMEARTDGQIALDAFLAANALKNNGVQVQDIYKTVFDSLDSLSTVKSPKKVKAGVEAAMRKWSGPAQLPSNSWKKILTSDETLSTVNPSNSVTWFDPFPADSKSPSSLQPGDIVVSPRFAVQQIQIPVDYALLDKSSAADAASFLKSNPPPSATATSDEPAAVELLDTQPIDDVAADECEGASYTMWGTPDFAAQFTAAALQSRILGYRKGLRNNSARIVIADSGFVLAKNVGAFRDDTFSQVGDFLHEEEAPEALGSKRVHGTMVAGLVLGGPSLWGMPPSLGLDIKITPATVFDVRNQAGTPKAYFKSEWLLDAIRSSGDIFNISLASKDKTQLQELGNYVTKYSSKLFIVAAGNNNMNSDSQGVDINDTELYPQRFGGNDVGPNVITVAAYDGKRLAKFSNYSEKFVSIAAPGCGVMSWAPDKNDAEYKEIKVTGTSFAAPIVAHVAAVVKALLPPKFAEPRYIRARILAGADLSRDVAGVEDGRVLNPLKAVSIYEDVIELEKNGERTLMKGQIESPLSINDLCANSGSPGSDIQLLKFARDPTPEAGRDSLVYFMRDGLLNNNKTCQHKSGSVAFTDSNGKNEIIDLKDIVDIVFRTQ